MKQRGGGKGGQELQRYLEEAAAALEEGVPGEALEAVKKVHAVEPGNLEAFMFMAFAHADLGELDEAAATFRTALKKAPEDLDLLFFAAELLVNAFGEEREALEEAVGLCRRGHKASKKKEDPESVYDFLLLEGTALNQLGASEDALVRIDEAVALAPGSVAGHVERGLALFELCRFPESKAALTRALELSRATGDEEDPYAHHFMGLMAEREGDEPEAKRRFAKARTLAAEEFAEPVTLSEEEFDVAVEAAIKKLPSPVKEYVDGATIAVEPFPPLEDLVAEKPPLSPAILGLFRGLPVQERHHASGVDSLPPSIVLYQRNLERFARTKDELIEQIGITVMHEVGHLIGLDEDDLWERGLD